MSDPSKFYAEPEVCVQHNKPTCPPWHPRKAAAVRGPLGLLICENDEQAEKLAAQLNDRARKRSFR
jgi:hypothetical protein